MAQTAILVPYPDMCETVHALLQDYPSLHVMSVEYNRTEHVQARAKELESQGCELVIARGLQALLIGQAVKLPLIEIQVTAQELGLLVVDIKEKLHEECPSIALVGFANMFADTSYFGKLFNVDLRRYLIQDDGDLGAAAELAIGEGAQAIIGGEVVCQVARQHSVPFRFLSAGVEGIRTALNGAAQASYAIDTEKRNSAEMNMMLDNIHSGIIQIDCDCMVKKANREAFNLLELQPQQLNGHAIQEVLPKLDGHVVESAIQKHQEVYVSYMDQRHRTIIINVLPIVVGSETNGALLTLQEGTRIMEMDSELRRELFQRGFIARNTFASLVCKSQIMTNIVERAKRIARYHAPILIVGEEGTGKAIMAQCIHNESLLHDNAFITVDCSAWLPETLDTQLFGNYTTRKDSMACLVELAEGGTLYLSHVDALTYEMQYKLLSLIRGQFLHNGSNRPGSANVRLIASSSRNLSELVEKGTFRNDLYYALSVLSVELPPLSQRREDIIGWVELYLKHWQEEYSRYVRLTQGAVRFLEEYSWPGNLDQVKMICERTVLLAERRNIDEVFLQKELKQIAPRKPEENTPVKTERDQKAEEILEALQRFHGNRDQVASALGISKTTLWRYMKKYGIERNFS